tara:strand:- start:2744 stop:3196 length:453 start_codon:yes stop_codon:yes gene_type:complete
MIYRVDFETIQKVWRENLWVEGDSADKRYNRIKIDGKFDQDMAEKTVMYWAYRLDDEIVGVNSGYKSCENYYRSRGLWVMPKFRGAGFAKSLLDVVIGESIFWNCRYVWSYPREEALPVYESMGFEKKTDFQVASYGFNCIAVKDNKPYK